MEFIKYSLLLSFLMATSLNAKTRFSSKSCLDSNFKMKMQYKEMLFGAIKHELKIKKQGCLIDITRKKFISQEWNIDVCREPVHIKKSSVTGVDVMKREGSCENEDIGSGSDFCSQYEKLLDVIQDDGLIFAQGDRDDLRTDHGQTFCVYLLIQRYLKDGIVFSRYTEVPHIFEKISAQVDIENTREEKDDLVIENLQEDFASPQESTSEESSSAPSLNP